MAIQSGTHLFYNGVLMRDCELIEYSQVIEYDESGTDPLFSRVRVTAASTLVSINQSQGSNIDTRSESHPSTIGMPSIAGETLVDRFKEIESRLQQPRKDFWFALNAVTTKDSPDSPKDSHIGFDSYRIILAATGDPEKNVSGTVSTVLSAFIGDTDVVRLKVIDSDNGPKPKQVDIQQVFGGRSMRVQFSIEICRCLCPDPVPEDPYAPLVPPVAGATKTIGVISNKWSVTDSLDSEWRSTHTISGTLVVKDQRYKAYAMRTMVTPQFFPYAKIISRKYAVDEAGLVLKYEHTMQETGAAPPAGVVDWDGTYSETTQLGFGMSMGDLSIRVRGEIKPPTGKTERDQKAVLLRALYTIALSRIGSLNQIFDPKAGTNTKVAEILKTIVIEQIGKPELELRCSVRYSDAAISEFNLRLANMGSPIGIAPYDPRWWPVPNAFQWDTVSELVAGDKAKLGSYFVGYFQSPCDDWHGMPTGFAVDTTNPGVPSPPTAPTSPSNPSVIPPSQSGFTAIVTRNLSGDLVIGDPPPAVNPLTSGVNSQSQLGGFSYLSWDSDIQYVVDEGKVHLPLSKIRVLETVVATPSILGPEYPDDISVISDKQTSIVLQLHAGLARRIFSMKATRSGNWPIVPEPKQVVKDASGWTEQLLKKNIVLDTPRLAEDNKTMIYGVNYQLIYAMSRPPGFEQTGEPAAYYTDTLRSASSQIDNTSPSGNRLKLADFFDWNRTIKIDA